MTIRITHLDGSQSSPSFAPEHKAEVIEYYNQLKQYGQILAWRVI